VKYEIVTRNYRDYLLQYYFYIYFNLKVSPLAPSAISEQIIGKATKKRRKDFAFAGLFFTTTM
jgi:hypothetical protein